MNSQSSGSRFEEHKLSNIKQQMCLFILGSWSLWWCLNAGCGRGWDKMLIYLFLETWNFLRDQLSGLWARAELKLLEVDEAISMILEYLSVQALEIRINTMLSYEM